MPKELSELSSSELASIVEKENDSLLQQNTALKQQITAHLETIAQLEKQIRQMHEKQRQHKDDLEMMHEQRRTLEAEIGTLNSLLSESGRKLEVTKAVNLLSSLNDTRALRMMLAHLLDCFNSHGRVDEQSTEPINGQISAKTYIEALRLAAHRFDNSKTLTQVALVKDARLSNIVVQP